MNDLISRRAAIKLAIDLDYESRGILKELKCREIENRYNMIPPAQLESRWIPVTERLPEEADGTVLVCMPDEPPYNRREPFINAKHNQQVEVAMYSQHSDTWFFGMGAVSSTRPIAWMPLPEPYKRSKDTDEIN